MFLEEEEEEEEWGPRKLVVERCHGHDSSENLHYHKPNVAKYTSETQVNKLLGKRLTWRLAVNLRFDAVSCYTYLRSTF